MKKYEPKEIEPKWQKVWEEKDLYHTDDETTKPKYYCLDFFPYPSGASLSVGHCRNYVPTDVISRYKRMNGFNVLHPMGWDAFGLPAENDALKKGIHPMDSIPVNVANFKRQLHLIGASYDWDREINSTDPTYYKWTQWLFLLLYKRGLAYQAEAEQWWCPKCKTVLANEQVENGKCWRCGSEVTKKALRQWFFKITAYADRLLADLDSIDWPEKIKSMQRNWIGRSEGVEVDFTLNGSKVRIFTTRPDTLYGATFMVLAPEHPLVQIITTPDQADEVRQYIERSKRKTEIDRLSETQEKTGVFTGSYAINPITNESIPVWIADYVLLTYGTGAIMAVPAHDERDFAFAKKYNIPMREVIKPTGGQISEFPEKPFVGEGLAVNSKEYDGFNTEEVFKKIADFVESGGIGNRKVNYKMRDWLISRQRYWGAPIPMVHCEKCGTVAVPEDQLPVLLPRITDFEPSGTGRSPLSKVSEFVNATCPQCGGLAERETDTQDGFACSSWYFLRYSSPHIDTHLFEPEAMKYWLPVDLYVGGAEHAVMHLLYARFYTKVMFDEGLIPFKEPFLRLKNQGMILAGDGRKMSKSYGNVITPDETVDRFGADALRLYELFIGPFEQEIAWDESGIKGAKRFLEKFWNLAFDETSGETGIFDDSIERLKNRTLKKVGEDIEQFKFNTAVAYLMEFINVIIEHKAEISAEKHNELVKTLTLILAPMSPYIAEEVWQEKYKTDDLLWSVHQQPWPEYDPSGTEEDTVTIAVQINGKTRGTIRAITNTNQEAVEVTVLGDEKLKRYLDGQEIRKVIFVANKIINFLLK